MILRLAISCRHCSRRAAGMDVEDMKPGFRIICVGCEQEILSFEKQA